MISLKKALAGISMLAIIVIAFSCSNNASSSSDSSGSKGKVVDGLGFDLSNAKSFFAGKASTSTARAIDENSIILMKITEDGKISPAMDFKGDDIYFNLNKIIKNPATKELFLLGSFSKSSWGENGYNTDWSYNLIRVDQKGNWYGLRDFQNIQTTQEPFDDDGNFYFQNTDWNSSSSKTNIYKYSGGTATNICQGNLRRVLPNGTIIYSVDNSGVSSSSYTYVRLRDGKVVQLDDYSTSIYVKDKNIFYYYLAYLREGYTTYYVDDTGNKYDHVDGSEEVYYAYKGGKEIYLTEVDGHWQDENGKTYNQHIFSNWRNIYWIFDEVGNKIYLTVLPSYYKDKDGNEYDTYAKSDDWVYWVVKNGEKIAVTYDNDSGYYKDSEENTYEYSEVVYGCRYYVFKNGKQIEVEYIPQRYEDPEGKIYDNYDNTTNIFAYWVYEGAELVKVKWIPTNPNYYQDEDGNEYSYERVYSDYEYYVTVNDKKVKVTPAQKYSTDVLVAKYYDFIANEKGEIATEVSFSNLSSYNFDTSSENVLGTTFITNYLWKFEMQSDFSLKCTYNLSEKGYTVATTWNSNYNFIGENNTRYLEKFLYNGEKIYFLGTKEKSWSSDASYNLYKIVRFGEPQPVLSSADASNYAFNGDITFDDDGNFIGSVLRKSDGKYGILSGSMEYGTYDFQENNIFESVTDIVINFD